MKQCDCSQMVEEPEYKKTRLCAGKTQNLVFQSVIDNRLAYSAGHFTPSSQVIVPDIIAV